MSVQPGRYNISLQRRADFYLQLQFKDSTGAPINLTGWGIYAQIWNKGRTTKHADFLVTPVNLALGTVKISLTDVETAGLPCESFYDVLLENPSEIKEYYLEGMIIASEGLTEIEIEP